MSKFNEKTDNKVENYMGGVSFKHTPKEELVFAVLTSFIDFFSRKVQTFRLNMN